LRDFTEYLQAYRAYISANLGWRAVLRLAAIWFAGMCVPLAAKVFVQLPTWTASLWMIVWALLGYVFGPYGMWKHQRAHSLKVTLHNRR
jgi:membrane protein DedA with SNARE-associated domain